MKTITDKLQNYNLILASASPRRKMLLEGLNLNFKTEIKNVEEIYPSDMLYSNVPVYLSQLKASEFKKLASNEIVITADTIVVLENQIIGKPKDKQDAIDILNSLSGKSHKVITGVTLTATNKQHSFSSESTVYFRKLKQEEIEFYIEKYKPMDKAGAYGIQEWIGYVGIEKIEGSFYNVMGLPTQLLYEELLNFVK